MFAVTDALGEVSAFQLGNRIRVVTRSSIGHYRMPRYLLRRGHVARRYDGRGDHAGRV
jgi:hypothetical protein